MLEKWVVLCRNIETAWNICAEFYSYDLAESELARLRENNSDLWFTVARESHLQFLNVED